ncbi:MAG: UDP-N-acetylglucosamine 2-epimerase (non-hydrolyzing) [Armatimonadetes bacterium]|jgi:UDP-N-acetylglucosamine 2-epimerase (non-hydrolysing)|nr:UDP-N-acetylglucosamine 2-epimerase (non-hydrolyzing) [Armatimonadota bacterium]HOM80815.1 UDP-N-acetylglucosamine 2-epimerase (non-hydrolyzing) [Armatimonadota bacterium]
MSGTFKIMAVFGTRPDALKMAPVVNELKRYPEKVRVVVAVTAQHREMLDQVLSIFDIRPDYDLNIMLPNQTLTQIATRALNGLDPILAAEQPQLVLVQGDTLTTFAAGLAAFFHRVDVGHVEAGLRTDDKYNPFPEEMNRRLTTRLADLHFAPTERARQTLLADGVRPEDIYVTGNTVIDALLATAEKPFEFTEPPLSEVDFGAHRTILVTAHRRENWGEPIRDICRALRQIIQEFPDTQAIFQMHKNPVVRDVIREELGSVPRVLLVEPQEYVPWVHLMKRAYLVLTDSGGIQEEAPSLGLPVLVMRETTERPEGVDAGVAKLVGTTPERIVAEARELLGNKEAYRRMAHAVNPYGDGRSAEYIREAIFTRYGLG